MNEQFDSWLQMDGPVAVILRETLEPVQGQTAVVFPPTFAPPEKGGTPAYIIDETSSGKTAILDTVGSQANRLEPLFKREPYSRLVPQASVKIGERRVDLLDAGHRGADAIVRFSSYGEKLRDAFATLAGNGDASKLAKLAPTSLVFGVWDSRGTQIKVPRLIASTVRAYGVELLSRSAQFFSAFEKEETEAWNLGQDFLSEQGFSDAPAGRTHGGVIARGGIVREATLNLIALRAIAATDAATTYLLQRYILGLALVALTAPVELYLREGCLLTRAAGQPATSQIVLRTGAREDFPLDESAAFEYAMGAATTFGVGEDWEASFDKDAVAKAAGAKTTKTKKGK